MREPKVTWTLLSDRPVVVVPLLVRHRQVGRGKGRVGRGSDGNTGWDTAGQHGRGADRSHGPDVYQLSVVSTGRLTVASPSVSASTPVDLGEMSPVEGDDSVVNSNDDNTELSTHSTPTSKGKTKDGRDIAAQRVDELSGLLVGFAVALQWVSMPHALPCHR